MGMIKLDAKNVDDDMIKSNNIILSEFIKELVFITKNQGNRECYEKTNDILAKCHKDIVKLFDKKAHLKKKYRKKEIKTKIKNIGEQSQKMARL